MKHTVVLALIAAIISSAASAGKVRVACVGDSITSGYALDNPERDSYPAQLQRLLGDGYEVANFGRPGLGVYRHQQRKGSSIAWEYSKAYAATLEFKPDILVAGLGANDWREHMKEFLPGTNGAPQVARGTFCAQYVDLLRRLKVANPEMRLIVCTKLTPLGSKHIMYGSPAPFVLREDLAKVADAVGAEPIDVFTELYPMRETGLAKDGIHPDPEMAGCLARIVARAIMPIGTTSP